MRVLSCIVLASFFSCLLLADQVTLKNGDIVSGQIVKKDGDSLTMTTEFMGEVKMPWSAITNVKSDNPLYVKLATGKEVSGKVSTAGNDVQVVTPAATETAAIGQVTTIRNAAEEQKYERLLHPNWFELWAGYVDLGYSLARGNARTDVLTTSFSADRVTNNDKTSLFLNQIYSTGTIGRISGTTANAARGGVSYNHNINSRWFWDALNTDEYDRFQNLDFRFVGGGGLGYHAIKTERTVLDLLLGGDYTHEAFTGNIVRNLGEINVGDTFSHKLTGITSINQSLLFFEAPSNGQYRLAFNAGAATTIHKWLSWQVSVNDSYLSAPVFGRKANDIFLSTGLRASFAR